MFFELAIIFCRQCSSVKLHFSSFSAFSLSLFLSCLLFATQFDIEEHVRLLIVTKLLKGRVGYSQIESQSCHKGARRDGIHSRSASCAQGFSSRPSLPFASSNQTTHIEFPFLAQTLLLERTRFYLSLSRVNGLCRAPRRVFEIYPLSLSLSPQILIVSPVFSLSLFLRLSCVPSYTFLSLLRLRVGTDKNRLG